MKTPGGDKGGQGDMETTMRSLRKAEAQGERIEQRDHGRWWSAKAQAPLQPHAAHSRKHPGGWAGLAGASRGQWGICNASCVPARRRRCPRPRANTPRSSQGLDRREPAVRARGGGSLEKRGVGVGGGTPTPKPPGGGEEGAADTPPAPGSAPSARRRPAGQTLARGYLPGGAGTRDRGKGPRGGPTALTACRRGHSPRLWPCGDRGRWPRPYKKPGAGPAARPEAGAGLGRAGAPPPAAVGDMGRYSGKTCRLLFMLVLTVAFFVAELVSGYLGNSIALLSDSFNMLSDLISLCVGLGAGYVARRPRGGLGATYGYARAEVLGALGNAVFLAALCFTIAVEAVLRLARPERIDDPELVLIVGALGLAVNVLGLLVFQDCAAGLACWGPRRRPPPPPPAERPGPRAPGGPRRPAAARAAAAPAGEEERGATVFSNVAGASRAHPRALSPGPRRPPPVPSASTPSFSFWLGRRRRRRLLLWKKRKEKKNPCPLQPSFDSLLLICCIPRGVFGFLLILRPLFFSFFLFSLLPLSPSSFSVCFRALIFLNTVIIGQQRAPPTPLPLH